jgi:hypothetical protein
MRVKSVRSQSHEEKAAVQGDQIERNFAPWVIVYFFLKIT